MAARFNPKTRALDTRSGVARVCSRWDKTGTVRAVLQRDVFEPTTPDEMRVKRAAGFKANVYDDQGQIVGYLVVGPLGFVEKAAVMIESHWV